MLLPSWVNASVAFKLSRIILLTLVSAFNLNFNFLQSFLKTNVIWLYVLQFIYLIRLWPRNLYFHISKIISICSLQRWYMLINVKISSDISKRFYNLCCNIGNHCKANIIIFRFHYLLFCIFYVLVIIWAFIYWIQKNLQK